MAVAKRPGKESPWKQNRGRHEGGSENLRQNKQRPCLARCTWDGPRDRETHRRGAEALSSLSPARWGALLFASLDPRALTPQRWIFLLLSNKQSCNTDLFKSYNAVCPPRAVARPGGFSVRHCKFLLWRGKEPRSVHSPDISIKWVILARKERTYQLLSSKLVFLYYFILKIFALLNQKRDVCLCAGAHVVSA